MKKRALSWLLALTMLLTLAPQTLPVWASAEEPNGTATQTESKLSANTYSALGLSRTIDENQKPSGQPYGNGDVGSTIATNVINELYVNFNGSIHYGWSILDKLTMQCTDQAGDNWTNKENSQGAMSYWRYGQQPKGSTGFGALYASGGKKGTLSSHIDRIGDTKSSSISSANKHLVYQYSKSEAFSPNTGKDNYVAELVVNDDGKVSLYIYQVEGGNKRYVRGTDIGKNPYVGEANDKTNIIWNWEYDAMFDIAAGDMDGDGYDEIAVYSSNEVRVYSYKNNTISSPIIYETKYPTGYISNDKTKKLGTAVVTLAFGDINADDKEELIIAESLPYGCKNIADGEVGIYALDNNTLSQKWSNKLYDGSKYVRYANVATGDIDGDYKDELIIAGYQSTNDEKATCSNSETGTISYMIVKGSKYTTSGWKTADQKIDLLRRVVDNKEQLIPPVSLTCAATQGVGYAEQVFLGGCLYTVNSDNSLKYLTRISTNREYKKDDGKKANKEEIFVVNVVAGNFNGNEYGQEQIVYAFGMKHDDSDRYWYDIGYLNKKAYGNTDETNLSAYWYGQEQVMNYESSYNRDSNKRRASLYLSLAAVDCDNDSTLMRYTGQEITWTKPEVLTVLQSAPYFQDLQDTRDYLDQSQTAYGTGHGTSTTATAGASLTLGTYVSFEQDFSVFGVKIASIEAEAQTKHSFEYGFEGTKEKKINITYSGSAGDDYAIVYAVPYIEYQYETWIPGYKIPEENNGYNSWKTEYVGNYLKGKLKNWSALSAGEQKKEIDKAVTELNLTPGREVQGSWQPSTVSVPMDPAKVLISVDAYDEIAAQTEGLEPIRGNILKSTPGDPSTYDSFGANSKFHLIGSTQTVSTGAGGNVSIEEDQEASQTHTFSYSYEFEAKAGVGAGGLTVGVLAGVGTNAGGGTGESSSKSCSATVDNLPSDATGYAFSWRFGTRKAKLNGNDVLVLEYQIDKSSLQQPPSPPRNLRVESVTADSVTLEWDKVPGAGSYEIYQTTLTETEDPVCIATVPGTATSYTDQRVLPNNSYTYYVKNVTPKGKSIFSTSIKVSTLLQNDGRFVIEEQPGSNHKFQTYVGGTATATVKAKYVSTDGGEKSLIYIWKKYNSKTKRWENYMSGSETLSVPNVTKNMEGDKFRCQVFYTSGLYMYTEPITLEVGKAETTTAMTGPDTNSTVNASYVEIVKNPVKDDDGQPVYEQVAVTKKIGDTTYTEYTTERKDKIVYLSGDDYYSISNETPTKLTTEDSPIQLYYDDADDTTEVIDLQKSSMIQDLTYPGEGNAKVSYTKTDDQTNQPVIYEADKKYTIGTIEGTIETYCTSGRGEEDDFWFVKIGTDENGQNKYAPATLEKETTIDPDGINVKVSELRLSTTQGDQMFTSEQVFHSGDTVSLRAKVTENAGFAAAKIEGSVAFKIVNSVGDGSGTVTGTIGEDGVATATWKPSVAGVYTITAAYKGSEIHMGSASAGSITINVVVPGEKKLVIDSPNSMTYGDAAIDLKATLLSGAEGSGTGSAAPVTATYSVKDAAGNTVSNAIADNKFAPKAASNYTITATCTVDGKSFTATKTINVSKRTVKIVPKVENNVTSYTLENIVSADDSLFKGKINVTCAGVTTGAAAGQYPINVTYTPGTDDNAKTIDSRYLVILDTTQVYTVSDDVVKVTNATNSNSGTVTLQYIVNGVTYTVGSDGVVPKKAKLVAYANPKKGYQVEKWTINDNDVYLNGNSGAYNTARSYTVTEDVQENCKIKAEFKPVYYKLNFNVEGENGTVTANYWNGTTVGSSFKNGGELSPLHSVQLTANVPGKSITGWKITQNGTDEIVKVDGTTYTGSSYILTSISADTTVTVLTEAQEECTVKVSLVNADGTPLVNDEATVSFSPEGTKTTPAANGVFTYNGHTHDNLTVTLTLPDGLIVNEWVDDAGKALTDGNLSGDKKTWDISNLSKSFAWTVKCSTPNSFRVTTDTQLNGQTSTEAGTISVYKAGQSEEQGKVNSGDTVLQASSLRVVITPNSGYQLWNVTCNEEPKGVTSDFTINGVNENINIVANFVKKPVVTVVNPDATTKGNVTLTGTVNGVEDQTVSSGGYVDYNTSVKVTVTPKKGYEVTKLKKGTDEDATNYVLIPTTTDEKTAETLSLTEAVILTPTFVEIPHKDVTISVVDQNDSAQGGFYGSVTASVARKSMDTYAESETANSTGSTQTLRVYRDSTVTLSAQPDTGYVAKWIYNGQESLTPPTLDFSSEDKMDNHNVQVRFDPIGKKITFGKEGEHSSPVTATFKPDDGNEADFASGNIPNTNGILTLKVTPNAGYEVEGWYVNGHKKDNSAKQNTFEYPVKHDVGAAIEVKIIRSSYEVNFSAVNGTIVATPAIPADKMVMGDTSVTFTATPAQPTGYTFAGWKINDKTPSEYSDATVNANGTLTVTIKELVTVTATYTQDVTRHTVTYGVDGETLGTLTTNLSASPTTIANGGKATFTATPKEGNYVVGWYSDAACTQRISETGEETSYSVDVYNDTTVYVKFAVKPTYTIRLAKNGNGKVFASVNDGAETEVTGNTLAVKYHDKVVFRTQADDNYYFVGWQDHTKGTYTIADVTGPASVTATFAPTQSVYLKASSTNTSKGTLTATGSVTGSIATNTDGNGVQVAGGEKITLTAHPEAGQMVKEWKIGTTVQSGNLSNTLVIDSITESTTVTVEFEEYRGFTLPSAPIPSTGYTITDVVRNPDDTKAGEIRKNGDLTFKVGLAKDYTTISKLIVNGYDCVAKSGTATNCDSVTAVKNADGSYTVTVKNITAAIVLNVEAHQVVVDDLTLPKGFDKIEELNTVQKIKDKLEANMTGRKDGTAFYDIALMTWNGQAWIPVKESNFPANGVDVVLDYPGDTNAEDTFKIVHMLATEKNGKTPGTVENVPYTKESDGLHFHVDSLSPFGVSWTKYVAPTPGGGGGGGGGGAVSTYTLTFDTNGGSAIDKITKDSGTTIDLAAYKPTRAGYTFAGWFSDKALTKAVTSVKLTANTTVYAKWTQNGGTAQNPFVDVKEGAYYYDAVLWAVEQKITSGTSATTFSPDASCTRAQMVTFLWRAAGSPKVENGKNPFTDVQADAYYYDAVLWAVEKGVTSGTSATTFSPDATVTRGQTVTFLYRNAGSPEVSGTMPFTDVEADAYYAKAVQWAVQQKITTGTSETTFSPMSDCTRGQIVTFLYRAK